MASSVINTSSNSQTYQLLLSNFQTALSNPLTERCSQLYQLLQDPPLKEIQYIFPGLIENIFGVRNGVDWGFLTIDKKLQVKEFDGLRKLLAPDGPLLKVVYKLTEEISPKFEFPFAWLPMPSQLVLQEGKIPPLYANKMHMTNPGMFPSVLQLNAYEFFFFHFCYLIVNPILKNSISTVNQQDTLYAHLLEDYLTFFLPTENRAVPLYQPQTVQHSPVLTASLSSSYGSPHTPMENRQPFNVLTNNCARPDFLISPARQKPSLLKKGAIMMVTSPVSETTHGGFVSSQNESWKSETLILILKEMLLNQNSVDALQQNMQDLIPKTFIPTHYHVWMVRIMVKHLHFFFNSTLCSSQSTGHGQIMIDSLGRLKSLGMTQLIHKEMYAFLKTVFDHWPLDASFRVPLETYLSYIQPWRYTQCDLEPSVWQKFMTENILFYTTIFIQILRRFLRMDLNCPKNAYMLYRLTKVVCTSELREMIMQAEKGCISKPSNIGMPGFLRCSDRLSFHRISQLETSGSGYLPLFSEKVFIMVTHLLTAIASAIEKCNVENSTQSVNKSFFDKFCSFFENSSEAVNSDDNASTDLHKVSYYLDMSSKQLCNFFQEVSPPSPQYTNMSLNPLNSPGRSYLNAGPETCKETSRVMDRVNVVHKQKPDIEYHGDPDLQPVRTYEIGFLVNFLNEVSQHLNYKYASEIEQLYNRDSILGGICRRLLAPPVTYFNVTKSKDMMSVSRQPVHLPPRINLRILANMHVLGYSFLFLFLNYSLASNPLVGLIFLLSILCLLLLISCILYPVPIPAHLKDD